MRKRKERKRKAEWRGVYFGSEGAVALSALVLTVCAGEKAQTCDCGFFFFYFRKKDESEIQDAQTHIADEFHKLWKINTKPYGSLDRTG